MTDTGQYDYTLPKHLIAQYPLAQRDQARLMLLDRAAGAIDHYRVRDLPELLREGDVLVLNDTRVVPARLLGRRTATGGRWEGLFLSETEEGFWRLLAKTRGKVQPGETVTLLDGTGREDLQLELLAQGPGGAWLARPPEGEDTWELLQRIGRVPLPHYIRGGVMEASDREHYQTVFARRPGSAAAPTAGLHFTEPLLQRLERGGIGTAYVTLHVGLDTFRPIQTDTIEEHPMHSEWGCLDEATAEQLRACRQQGGRVVAVGTTVVRVLETAAREGELRPWSGRTELFIRPPHEFRGVDALLTNFHLPRSTLLVLVRTFGGDELVRRAYYEAVQEEYRFYSYGDAMLIV